MVLFDFANKRTKARGVKHTKQLHVLSALHIQNQCKSKKGVKEGGTEGEIQCKRNGVVNMRGREESQGRRGRVKKN